MTLLSIIIPVYNVASTLNRCIESVAGAAIPDIEIILVDDGSTDQSPLLCDEWQERDQRISVIHKSNGGLSDARNHGLEAATGQYIAFIDSDDYIEPGSFRQLLDILGHHPEYDILEFPVIQHEGSAKEHLLTFPDQSYTSASEYWYGTKAYLHTYAWNKIYKRHLFRSIRFPVGKLFEDAYTLPQLLLSASVVATCSKGVYHYCYNAGGITATADGRAWQMLLDAHIGITRIPQFSAYNNEDYYLHLVNIQIFTYELTGNYPVVEDRPVYKANNAKTILLKLLGINKLCKANKLFRTIIRRR
jgi:glycosyltransferase involved in cell wall biosynthesis